jgi:hypothetical protein
MPVAAFYLSVFDLKYGKFPRTGPGPGQTEFAAVRAYIPKLAPVEQDMAAQPKPRGHGGLGPLGANWLGQAYLRGAPPARRVINSSLTPTPAGTGSAYNRPAKN